MPVGILESVRIFARFGGEVAQDKFETGGNVEQGTGWYVSVGGDRYVGNAVNRKIVDVVECERQCGLCWGGVGVWPFLGFRAGRVVIRVGVLVRYCGSMAGLEWNRVVGWGG